MPYFPASARSKVQEPLFTDALIQQWCRRHDQSSQPKIHENGGLGWMKPLFHIKQLICTHRFKKKQAAENKIKERKTAHPGRKKRSNNHILVAQRPLLSAWLPSSTVSSWPSLERENEACMNTDTHFHLLYAHQVFLVLRMRSSSARLKVCWKNMSNTWRPLQGETSREMWGKAAPKEALGAPPEIAWNAQQQAGTPRFERVPTHCWTNKGLQSLLWKRAVRPDLTV